MQGKPRSISDFRQAENLNEAFSTIWQSEIIISFFLYSQYTDLYIGRHWTASNDSLEKRFLYFC